MKIAAYQAPLLRPGSIDALALVRAQIDRCEAEGVSFVCCPEAVLGGLADYSDGPIRCAIPLGQLASTLAVLASDTVTTIVGFTELAADGRLYNAAAVHHRGSIVGLYRKRHPAINRSVYAPGTDLPLFDVGGLTFGIIICNDSNHPELAKSMVARGARVLFVPTNNGLPVSRSPAALVGEARKVDLAMAVGNHAWIVRADVAGRTDSLISYGSSAIVDVDGTVVASARQLAEDLVIADAGALDRPFTESVAVEP